MRDEEETVASNPCDDLSGGGNVRIVSQNV
jgi:hypothetical protein